MSAFRRSICALLAAVMLFSFAPVTALAEEGKLLGSGSIGDNATWTLTAEGLLTISGTGPTWSYETEEHPGKAPYHKLYSKVKTIVVEEGITHLGDYLFYAMTKCTAVSLPDSLVYIGERAFQGLHKLEELVVPKNVKELASFAIISCQGMKKLTLPDGLEIIGPYAIKTNYYLEEVNLPKNLKVLGEGAFLSCTVLRSIEIPDGVTAIEAFTFANTAITSVKLPANLKSIGNTAFNNCANLENVEIPETVEQIGYGAFMNCPKLTEITVPEGIKVLDESVFSNCSALKTVNLPGTVEILGTSAFAFCTGLEEITLPEAVKSIGDQAFRGCTGLKKVQFLGDAPTIGYNAFGDVTAQLVYLGGREGWMEAEEGNYGGTLTWNAILPCDYYGHKEDILPGEAATCTKTGISEGKACRVCGRILEAQQEIPMLPHTEAIIPGREATCTEAGLTEGKVCTVCAVTTLEQEIIKAMGHVEQLLPARAPGCTEYGLTEGKVCAVCQEVLAEQEEIPATGIHVYEDGQCVGCGEPEQEKLAAPEITAANVASSGKIRLTWEAVAGAVKYEIWRSAEKNSGFSRIRTQKGTTYNDASAKAGTTYYYKVKAVDSAGNVSQFSNRVGRMCDLKRPAVKASNDAATGKVKLTWDKIEGAKAYKIYRAAAKNGKYTLMKTVTGNGYTNANAQAGKKYFYKVLAVHENSNANSAYSAAVSRMCDLARPSVTVKRNEAGKPRISWKKVEGAVKYEVWRASAKNGKYTRIATTKNLYQVNKNAVAGKTYYYKVRAVHSNSNANSAFSVIKYMKAK